MHILFLLLILFFGELDNNVIDVKPDIYFYYPAREANVIGGLLGDIDSHYSSPVNRIPRSTYRNAEDKVNWAHEMTHAISAQLGNEYYKDHWKEEGDDALKQGYYLGHDTAIYFDRSLDFHIDHIRAMLPNVHKVVVNPETKEKTDNNIYKVYLKSDRQGTLGDGTVFKLRDCRWMLDELVAYTNGCEVRKELKLVNRNGSHEGGYELLIYNTYLGSQIKSHKEFEKYKQFILDQFKRLDDNLLTERDKQVRINVLFRDPNFATIFKDTWGVELK